LVLRIHGFESGQSLLEQFRDMMTMTGVGRLTMSQIRCLFPPQQRPSTNLRRIGLVSEYILYCAGRFEITGVECEASVSRSRVAHRLRDLQGLPIQSVDQIDNGSLTPEDLEAADWRDRTIRSVHGLPWIVREHIFRHVSPLSRPWHPVFVADRIDRLGWCRPEHHRTKSVVGTSCEDRFINTPACWYRPDPFVYIPSDLLELVCAFVGLRDTACVIDASRSLAMACCGWVRRVHSMDSLIQDHLIN
jgi:hypothetical protein